MGVNINKASVEEIANAGIQQVDDERAEDIVKYRDENGPFESWDDVKNVPGFSDERVRDLQRANATL